MVRIVFTLLTLCCTQWLCRQRMGIYEHQIENLTGLRATITGLKFVCTAKCATMYSILVIIALRGVDTLTQN